MHIQVGDTFLKENENCTKRRVVTMVDLYGPQMGYYCLESSTKSPKPKKRFVTHFNDWNKV